MSDGPPFVSDFAVQVTFSWRISNCLSTAPSSLCEWSSTTSIFHFPGGLTDLRASRYSGMRLVVRRIHDETWEAPYCCVQLWSRKSSSSWTRHFVAKFHNATDISGAFCSRCLLLIRRLDLLLTMLTWLTTTSSEQLTTHLCMVFLIWTRYGPRFRPRPIVPYLN